MSEYIEYPSRARLIIGYGALSPLFGNKVLTCIDRGVLEIAVRLLNQRGRWRVTYAQELRVGDYRPITQLALDGINERIDEYISDFMGVDEMNCEISEALSAIANSMAGGGPCGNCGSSGAGSSDVSQSTEDTGPIGSPIVPDGFADRAEYEDYKCDVATTIVSNLESDVGTLSTIGFVGMTVGAFVSGVGLALLSPIPGDELFALGLLIIVTLLALGVQSTVLSTCENAVVNNFDDLVCSLYEAENASEAETDFRSALESAVDGETSDAVTNPMADNVLDAFINNVTINDLFEKNSLRSFETGSCGDCVFAAGWYVAQGTIDPDGISVHTQTGGGSAGYTERVTLYYYHTAAGCDELNPLDSVTLNDCTPTSTWLVRASDDCTIGATLVYDENVRPTLPKTYSSINVWQLATGNSETLEFPVDFIKGYTT